MVADMISAPQDIVRANLHKWLNRIVFKDERVISDIIRPTSHNF